MNQLITKDYIKKIKFYQMPKDFFANPLYIPMRCESKLAYMFMRDLLSLSIQNNWVNDNDEVFVKLSRDKLMDLLGIKGSQKAAQVIKELVDYKLIVYKKVGYNRCNEIYLYHPKSVEIPNESPKKPSKEMTEKTSNHYTPAENLDVDIDVVNDLLENQIHIENLRQKYDPKFVDEIANNIGEMYLNTTTRVGKQNKPMSIIRNMIKKLQMHHIEHVIDQFKEIATTTKILNPKRYLQTMIYNSVYEANAKIISHIKYNFGY